QRCPYDQIGRDDLQEEQGEVWADRGKQRRIGSFDFQIETDGALAQRQEALQRKHSQSHGGPESDRAQKLVAVPALPHARHLMTANSSRPKYLTYLGNCVD